MDMMDKGKKTAGSRGTAVKVLAHLHRFALIGMVFLTLGAVYLFGLTKKQCMLLMGAGSLLYAAWSLIGYLLRWKHIFCSYQDANHQKMTPDGVNWSKVKPTDAYGLPAIFFVIGGLLIAAAFLGL